MRLVRKLMATSLALLALAGCADMSPRGRNTAIGAAAGAVAGSALTDSTLGTLGGAAVGGYIGNQYTRHR
ncbi:MAG TPA: glycine zipper 2TM domain-containing protein [Rhodocyclaceae bacterium]